MRSMTTVYHVVTSADGTVFAVFGSRNRNQADMHAKLMTDTTGVHRVQFFVDTVRRSTRPRVGTRL